MDVIENPRGLIWIEEGTRIWIEEGISKWIFIAQIWRRFYKTFVFLAYIQIWACCFGNQISKFKFFCYRHHHLCCRCCSCCLLYKIGVHLNGFKVATFWFGFTPVQQYASFAIMMIRSIIIIINFVAIKWQWSWILTAFGTIFLNRTIFEATFATLAADLCSIFATCTLRFSTTFV